MSDIPARIRRVELRCSDVEASAGFYAGLVGLEAEFAGGEARLRATGAADPLLVLRAAEHPGRAPRRASGLFHTAFRFRTRPALAAALARCEELGVGLSGVADHGVSEALYLDDPDGLGVELYRDRPREQWPAPGPDERIRMFTEPLDLSGLAAAAPARGSGPSSAEIDLGHIHLKVTDTGAAERFWTEEVGMELMTRFGADASFLAHDGYHHHVGVNSWLSRGAGPAPATGPGLDAVAIATDGDPGEASTPDGIRVLTEPREALR